MALLNTGAWRPAWACCAANGYRNPYAPHSCDSVTVCSADISANCTLPAGSATSSRSRANANGVKKLNEARVPVLVALPQSNSNKATRRAARFSRDAHRSASDVRVFCVSGMASLYYAEPKQLHNLVDGAVSREAKPSAKYPARTPSCADDKQTQGT